MLDTIKKFDDIGEAHNIIPLRANDKVPLMPNWTSSDSAMSVGELQQYVNGGHNLGLRVPENWLVLDIDRRNGGDKSFEDLTDLIPELIVYSPTVITPGGEHYYFRLPDGTNVDALKSKLHSSPGIDIRLPQRHQVVLPGSIHPSGGVYKFHSHPQLPPPVAPAPLVGLLTRPVVENVTVDNMDEWLARNGWGIVNGEELGRLLRHLPVERYAENETWFSLLASCHFATAGEGMLEFIDWSTSDVTYADDTKLIETRWNSLSTKGALATGGNPITIKTLLRELNNCGVDRTDVTGWLHARLHKVERDQDLAAFDIVVGDTEADTVKLDSPEVRWLNAIAAEEDRGVLMGSLLLDIASDPSLTHAQLDFVLATLGKKLGVPKGKLEKDVAAQRSHPMDSDGVQDVTQLHIAEAVLKKLGGVDRLIYSQGKFWQWSGSGSWEHLDVMTVEVEVLAIATAMGVNVNSGLISSVLKLITLGCAKGDNVWDTALFTGSHGSPVMINLLDGELHLDTTTRQWKLRPHNPLNYRRSVLNISWGSPYVEPKNWLNFLKTSMGKCPDDEYDVREKALGTMIGYTMIESFPWLKKCAYLLGPSNSGKSVCLDTVRYIIGKDNTSNLNLTQLGNRFGPAALNGKLMNASGEVKRGGMLEDDVFKSLVAGDEIQCENKGENLFTMTNHSVLWFAANNLPRHNDRSDAVFNRVLIIPFTEARTHSQMDPGLRDKLEIESDSIARWALEIFTEELLADRALGAVHMESAASREAKAQWHRETAPELDWSDEFLVTTGKNSDFVTTDEIYVAYTCWCSAGGLQPLSRNKLATQLTEQGFRKDRRRLGNGSNPFRGFQGVKLANAGS